MSARRTALKMGDISRNSVIGRAARLGLKFNAIQTRNATSFNPSYVRPVKPKPVPPPLPEAPVSHGLTIEALSDKVCRWPEGFGPVYSFCGHGIKPSSPYCVFHSAKAFVPAKTSAT